MSWPDFVGPCSNLQRNARDLLNEIIAFCFNRPGWGAVQSAAIACRNNMAHGLHATTSDAAKHASICAAHVSIFVNGCADPQLVLPQVNHGG